MAITTRHIARSPRMGCVPWAWARRGAAPSMACRYGKAKRHAISAGWSTAGCLRRRRRTSKTAVRTGGIQTKVDLEVLIENVANALVAGVTIGCIYGLMCIGLGLIFGIMRIVNFAQGELLMLGMYASLYLVTGAGV